MIIFGLLDSRALPGLWEPEHDLSVCCELNVKYTPYLYPKNEVQEHRVKEAHPRSVFLRTLVTPEQSVLYFTP